MTASIPYWTSRDEGENLNYWAGIPTTGSHLINLWYTFVRSFVRSNCRRYKPMCVLYVIPHWVSSQPTEFHMGVTKIPSVRNNIVREVDFYLLKDRSVDLCSILFPQVTGRNSAHCRNITAFFITWTPDTLNWLTATDLSASRRLSPRIAILHRPDLRIQYLQSY
jgi:hypothetical protein